MRISQFGLLLTGLYVAYVVMSWLLFLRDEWAVQVMGRIYPQWEQPLLLARNFFLPYGLNSLLTLAFAFLVVSVFSLYLWFVNNNISPDTTVKWSVVFSLILFFAYPALSTDIFDYMLSDWQLVVCGKDVWQFAPLSCRFDKFHLLAGWRDQVNPYGPVNQFFYTLAGGVAQNSFLVSYLAHKFLPLLFYWATVVLYWVLARSGNLKISGGTIALVLWNPLFLVETVGNGHNDILLIFFLLWSISLFLKQKFFWAGLLLALAVQVKFVPIVLAIYWLILLLARKNYRGVVSFLGTFVSFNFLALGIIGQGLPNFVNRLSFSTSLYWQSLPSLVHKYFFNEQLVFKAGFLLVLAAAGLQIFRRKIDPILAFTVSFFLYFLFFTSVYWNWYGVWVLCLLPFIKSPRVTQAVVLLSFSSLLLYPLRWLFLRLGNFNDFPVQVIMYTALIILPFWGYIRAKLHPTI